MMTVSLLTAIIPVTSLAGRLGYFEDTINQCRDFNLNVIVVHDFRDEETGSEVKAIIQQSKSEKIQYTEGVFGSAGNARNAGLELCNSKWVCFWDADDEVHVKNFLEMVTAAEEGSYEVAIGLISIVQKKTSETPHLSQAISPKKFLDLQIANFPAFTRMSFRTKNIAQSPFPNIPLGEDVIFLLRQNVVGKEVYLYGERVYTYFLGSESQSTSKYKRNSNLFDLLVLILDELESVHESGKRFTLAFVNKTFLAILRRAIKRQDKMISWDITRRVVVKNVKMPLRSITVIVYLLTHRLKEIKATHA